MSFYVPINKPFFFHNDELWKSDISVEIAHNLQYNNSNCLRQNNVILFFLLSSDAFLVLGLTQVQPFQPLALC